jgi:hypothetical protein
MGAKSKLSKSMEDTDEWSSSMEDKDEWSSLSASSSWRTSSTWLRSQ